MPPDIPGEESQRNKEIENILVEKMANDHGEETEDIHGDEMEVNHVEETTVMREQVDDTTTRGEDPVKMSRDTNSSDEDNKQTQTKMHTPAEVTDGPEKGTA